jgi:hypothetical protein
VGKKKKGKEKNVKSSFQKYRNKINVEELN